MELIAISFVGGRNPLKHQHGITTKNLNNIVNYMRLNYGTYQYTNFYEKITLRFYKRIYA